MLAALAMGVNLLNNAFGGSAVEDNPLSFFDGKLTLDVQDRVRWEMRENNFDFNSSRNVSTDDGWLLQRFRLGVRYEPESWLRFYAQGQDTREIWGNAKRSHSFLGPKGTIRSICARLMSNSETPRSFPSR